MEETVGAKKDGKKGASRGSNSRNKHQMGYGPKRHTIPSHIAASQPRNNSAIHRRAQ